MDVQVHHRLPDVVAVGVEPFVEEGFCVPDEGEEGGEFRVEEVRDVAVGDEEEVAGADGVPVNSGRSRGRFARTISSARGLQNGQVRASMPRTPGRRLSRRTFRRGGRRPGLTLWMLKIRSHIQCSCSGFKS